MAQQADQTSFRWSRIDTGSITRQSSPGVGLAPDFTMSPNTVSKLPTTGFLLQLFAPLAGAAVPNAGGFIITVWVQDPATGRYSAFDSITIGFQELFVTYDIDASRIWFQIGGITTDGLIDFGIAEQ